MQTKVKQKQLRALSAKSHRGHSDLYRYLRANYDVLMRRGLGTAEGPSWPNVVPIVVEAGVSNIRGQAPAPDSIRRIWAKVVRDVTADAAKKVAAGSARMRPPARSTTPLTWTRPGEVASSVAAVPAPVALSGRETPKQAAARAQKNIADMLATIAERSGKTTSREG